MKLKSFYTAKETITRIKRKSTEREKGLILQRHKGLQKLNTKRTNNTIK
jgi:hypothetical protein